jgi:hypothetical protein
LFEPVEAAFNDVALPIQLGVERWWSAAAAALGGAAGDLIGPFRDGVWQPSTTQLPTGRVVGVALVRDQHVRSLPGPAWTAVVHRDGVQHVEQLRVVAGLTR